VRQVKLDIDVIMTCDFPQDVRLQYYFEPRNEYIFVRMIRISS